MHIVHIHVRVKTDSVAPFINATLENARLSLLEPGVARFDVLQDKANPESFVFTEVYRSPEGAVQHKATVHYRKWRDAVAEMMAEPRVSSQFSNLFPSDEAF